MQIFEYPYVIITVLVMFFIVIGLVGLYFTIKSVRTATDTVEKSFCSTGKLENDFEKATALRKNRCVIYISVSLDSMKRLYPESRAFRIYEQLKKILLKYFCVGFDGEIAVYGEDGFVVLCSMEAEKVNKYIDGCFDEISKMFISNGVVNVVYVNFGYHCTSSTEVSFKTALSRAKQACSIAEHNDMLCRQWDSSDAKSFEIKIKIENNIHNEIDNNRFFLEYQPVIDAKTEKLIGAEVLSRLNSSTEGILTPFSFLSAVNNVGINDKFDYYIFEKNCKWISSDKENRGKYVYTINFSRSTLCDENFADTIIKIVEEYGVDYSCIAIEILEDKNLNEQEKNRITQNLTCLKEKGMLVLLDDFGKGYTSFGDLTDFDINIVKIDKSITQNAINKTGFLILKNIIITAHDLGFKALCEGIETEEHKKAAVDAGCDMLQGYYFNRPMPVTQFEKLFEKQ